MVERAAPELTIVVPSVNGWGDLAACLRALAVQSGETALEIIVIDRVGEPVRAPVRREHPRVRIVEVAPRTTIPAMRAAGFRQARAAVVGVIEDHVQVPPDWAARMLEAHAEGAQVVGGSVHNAALDRTVDWAAFLCEYSHCLMPPTGASDWVTGHNTTYRHELLERFRGVIERGGWENHLHDVLRREGITLLSRPDIAVQHKKHSTRRGNTCTSAIYTRARMQERVLKMQARVGAWRMASPHSLFRRCCSSVPSSGFSPRGGTGESSYVPYHTWGYSSPHGRLAKWSVTGAAQAIPSAESADVSVE
ncbi:hypothetical protein BH23GEM3_BH23GEM3_10000 [soil metagenome]